jgi:hypothetical protein
VKAVQLGLFTGEPVAAEWVRTGEGAWRCVRCLRVVDERPRRRCSCGWRRRGKG